MPSPRSPPPGFGIRTGRTGAGLYVPASNFALMLFQWRRTCAAVSSMPMPSIPAAPRLAFTAFHAAFRLSTASTCSSRSSFSAFIHNLPPGPSSAASDRFASRNPPVGSPSAAVLVDGLSGDSRNGFRSPAVSLSLCAFGPSLQPLSQPSSLLWPLLTSARLSTGRSPRVRCMNSRAGPSDSTQCAFR